MPLQEAHRTVPVRWLDTLARFRSAEHMQQVGPYMAQRQRTVAIGTTVSAERGPESAYRLALFLPPFAVPAQATGGPEKPPDNAPGSHAPLPASAMSMRAGQSLDIFVPWQKRG